MHCKLEECPKRHCWLNSCRKHIPKTKHFCSDKCKKEYWKSADNIDPPKGTKEYFKMRIEKLKENSLKGQLRFKDL